MACPVCNNQLAEVTQHPAHGGKNVKCHFCGDFSISSTLVQEIREMLLQKDAATKLSHAIRKAHEGGSSLLLDSYTAEAVLQNSLPRPREQADLLLNWLAQNSPDLGESIEISFDTHGAIVAARSHAGFAMLIEHLKSSRLVEGNHTVYSSGDSQADIALSFEGWDKYESLRLGASSYRKAFMAMKFGDEHLNAILFNALKPAAKRAGFDLRKLDDTPRAGLIDDRMRVEIRAADFVVADLTHENAGAYWEAGYAEGLGKPVIYTCERSKFERARTHFDTNHHLTIVWSSDNPREAEERLVETIRATLPHLAVLADA